MQGKKPYSEKLFNNFQLSERVPKDNFYRQLKEVLDLHFLYKATSPYYGREGQKSIVPVVFFKLILVGYLENLNSDRKIISRVVPSSGKIEWAGEPGSQAKIESSPTGADDKIYFMNHRGDVFVVEAGEQFKLLHTAAMGDEGDHDLRSSIAVAQGCLFIRTGSKLYCVGNK
jgi:outer membrane protein assembly factor BamB